jgi:hypothetical protein
LMEAAVRADMIEVLSGAVPQAVEVFQEQPSRKSLDRPC